MRHLRFEFFFKLLVAIQAGIATSASAADITHIRVHDRDFIVVSGELKPGDEKKFEHATLNIADAAVHLDSPGGSLAATIEIGKMVSSKKYRTVVQAGATCTSGCALIWVAGSKRSLSGAGKVGFHASFWERGDQVKQAGVGNALIGRYLTLLNLPERAILFATIAGPDEVRWLDASKMAEAGIQFEPFNDQDAIAFAKSPVAVPPSDDAGAYHAEASVEVGNYGWWTLYRNPARQTCHILTIYEDDEALFVEYDAREADVFVVLTNKNSSSLADGDKRKLNLPFLDGRQLDEGWEDVEFTAKVTSDGKRMLFSENLTVQFLKDFAEGSTLGFYFGDTLIGAYRLRSSARAISALRDCAKRVAGINPRDPFAQ